MSVKKSSSKTKALFFDPKYLIFIISFMATLNLACNSDSIHEEAAMWVILYYVPENLKIALSIHMNAKHRLASIVAIVRNKQRWPREQLRS